MKRSVIAALTVGFATVVSAQDAQAPMLSRGETFALRSMDELPGQGMTGTFAFRMDPKGTELPGQWVTFTSVACKDVLARGPFITAMSTRVGARADLPALTGAAWEKLEEDILNGMEELHKRCSPAVSMNSKPVRAMEP